VLLTLSDPTRRGPHFYPLLVPALVDRRPAWAVYPQRVLVGQV